MSVSERPLPERGTERESVAERQLAQAHQLHKSGKPDAAESLYRAILAAHPDHPPALHGLGLVAYQAGNYEAAIRLLEAAVSLAGK